MSDSEIKSDKMTDFSVGAEEDNLISAKKQSGGIINLVTTIAALIFLFFAIVFAGTGIYLDFYLGRLCKNDCTPKIFKHGAVASDHPVCSTLGKQILEKNGTAMDAMVTTELCQGLMQMQSTGIGGGGIMLIRMNDKPIEVVDFRESAPLGAHRDMYNNDPMLAQKGGLAAAVPGTIKGLYYAWEKYGKLPWKELVDPVIQMAHKRTVGTFLSISLNRKQEDIKQYADLASILMPNGVILEEGDEIIDTALGKTFEILAQDPMALYREDSELVKNLVADIKKAGGIINETDFSSYALRTETPLSTFYRGYEVFGPRPEISGGACILMALNIIENYNLEKQGYSAQVYHKIVESMKYIFAYRMHLGDPSFVNVDHVVNLMLSKRWAGSIRKNITEKKTFNGTYYAIPNEGLRDPKYDSGTSHTSIIDKDRNSVSLTSTINLEFGCFVRSPSTGILLNNEMDDFSIPGAPNYFGLPPSVSNFIQPRKRPLSSMAPTMVLKNNKLHLTIGASGGPRITTSVLQVLLNNLDFHMNVAEATSVPRLHHQLFPDILSIEKGFKEEIVDALRDINYPMRLLQNNDGLLGVVQAIAVEGDVLHANSDYRKHGKADGY